jgi:signal transduction histidine kinase
MKKVLVIDDTAEIRMIIQETLSMFGFSTIAAEDGETGIDLAQRNLPDLIICDVNMPKLDGFGTLARLRENELTATIPFMFLSGAVERPSVRRGMEMGADDYLTKPFTPSELLAAVNARLEKHAEIERKSEKKLDELRGNMTLALPHELRTPLNGIMGLAAILMEDHATAKPEEVFESAKHIHESALRLHKLIENFLVFAQIELMANDPNSIAATAKSSRTDAAPILDEVSKQIAARYRREGDLQLDVRPCSVPAIADNLRKIVEELVDNAFKFSAPGTPVRVSASGRDHACSLTISDRGRGMTIEQIARIGPQVQFEREKYEQQGAGLGLIIAKRLAQLNGGEFGINSVPGKETTVMVKFTAPPG